jgi:hypothetical protein
MTPRIALVALGLFGCGGAPFTLESPGVESGPVGVGDAGDPAAADALDAREERDAAGDEGETRVDTGRHEADAPNGDDLTEASPDAPTPALCCNGQESVPVALGVCFSQGAGLSETCAATPDGGQVCTTRSSAPPSACSEGAPCIETVGAQTLPGTVGPCF